MSVTKNDISNIAHLARIAMTEEEIELYQNNLSSVLRYFEQLQKVDTDQVEEIGHITGIVNVYRKDDVVECDLEQKKNIMKNTRNTRDDYIEVNSVLS